MKHFQQYEKSEIHPLLFQDVMHREYWDRLEIRITNRAQEIFRHRSGHGGQSLASWLEAAKEILSEQSEAPS